MEGNDYRNDMLDLMDLYKQEAFLRAMEGHITKSMMSMEDLITAVYYGVVKVYDKGYADIGVYEDINVDVLEIRSRRRRTYEITVKDDVQRMMLSVRGAGALKNHPGIRSAKHVPILKSAIWFIGPETTLCLNVSVTAILRRMLRKTSQGFCMLNQVKG